MVLPHEQSRLDRIRLLAAICLWLVPAGSFAAVDGDGGPGERLYTYRDSSGTLHIVSERDRIPEAHREDAVEHAFEPRVHDGVAPRPSASSRPGESAGLKRILEERRWAIEHQARRVRDLEAELRRQAAEEERRRDLARRERASHASPRAAKATKKGGTRAKKGKTKTDPKDDLTR